jgi:hypothetical protein
MCLNYLVGDINICFTQYYNNINIFILITKFIEEI